MLYEQRVLWFESQFQASIPDLYVCCVETADGDAEQTNLQVAGYVTPPSNPQGRCPLATIANTNSTEADCSCSSISGLETVSKPHEDLYTWKAQTPMPHPQQEGRRLESWNSAEKGGGFISLCKDSASITIHSI